jgi:hypothetical protein
MKKAKNKAKTANKANTMNKTANKPPVKPTKTKKAKSPNIVLQKSKSPQNMITPNNFEEAYRAMGVGMTRAQFKAQY